jgi:hypothetical protein
VSAATWPPVPPRYEYRCRSADGSPALVTIASDGSVYLRGELVETDAQRLQAFGLIVGCVSEWLRSATG